jgi:hypothetical protein
MNKSIPTEYRHEDSPGIVTDENMESHLIENRRQFCKVWNEFMNDIIGVFPEHAKIVTPQIIPHTETTRIDTMMTLYMATMKPHAEKITNKSAKLFRIKDLELFPGFPIRHIWTHDIGESTREAIWKYLSGLFFLGSMSDSESQNYLRSIFEMFATEFGKAATATPDISGSTTTPEQAEKHRNMMAMFENLAKMMGSDMSGTTATTTDSSGSHAFSGAGGDDESSRHSSSPGDSTDSGKTPQ